MKRAQEPQWKEPCGCVVDAVRFIKMCAAHEAEHKEIHDRWTADHIRMSKEEDARQAAAIKETEKTA